MTIDEAIEYEEEMMEINQSIAYNTDDDNWMDIAQCEKCAEEHRQLAEWLRELKQLREQTKPERKMGKWIDDGDCIICNKCNKAYGWLSIKQSSNYCPNCGAKMEV